MPLLTGRWQLIRYVLFRKKERTNDKKIWKDENGYSRWRLKLLWAMPMAKSATHFVPLMGFVVNLIGVQFINQTPTFVFPKMVFRSPATQFLHRHQHTISSFVRQFIRCVLIIIIIVIMIIVIIVGWKFMFYLILLFWKIFMNILQNFWIILNEICAKCANTCRIHANT